MLQVMTASVPELPRRRFFGNKQVNTTTYETDALCNEIRHVCRFDWMLFERIRLTDAITIPFALVGPKGLFLLLQNDAAVEWMTEESCYVMDPVHGKRLFTPHPISQSKRIVQAVRKALKEQGVIIPIHAMTLFPKAPQMRTERIKFPTGHTFKDVRAFIVSKKSSPVQEQERKQVAFYLAQHQE
ncbi:nuclease-related domain-containing protein [Exiguobacterium acetylicum]|uniref:nuclease-related domain-containing protein n=1 Tax=Exiguobacterium acetylicum TaxID=41170 RepID=UPI001EE37739|nr:nuclease-related domain-containing protein [Exiguobacterium acetylicum]UKS54844.1 NERD domain-containing protein [Exiguobacterium acetylicum]